MSACLICECELRIYWYRSGQNRIKVNENRQNSRGFLRVEQNRKQKRLERIQCTQIQIQRSERHEWGNSVEYFGSRYYH